MAQKKVKTRIQNKCDTLTNWGQASAFVPLKGELIVYEAADFTSSIPTIHKGAPRVKIGDASTGVDTLPFIGVPIEHTFVIPDVTENTFVPYYSDGSHYIYTLYNYNNFTIKFKPFCETDSSKTNKLVCLPTKTELYLHTAFMSGTEVNVEVDTDVTVGSNKYTFTPFVKADKCLLTNWAVSNVVTDGEVNLPSRTVVNGASKFKYKITAPSDVVNNSSTLVKITLQVIGGQRLYITNEVFI